MKVRTVMILVFCLCSLAATARAERPDPYLDFAHSLYAEGDHYRAITEAKRFLFMNPKHARRMEAQLLIGKSYLASGKLLQAQEALKPAAMQEENPELAVEARLDLATCLEKLGAEDKAAEYYRSLAGDRSLPPPQARNLKNQAVYRLGLLQMKQGRFEQARQTLAAVDVSHPLKIKAAKLTVNLEDELGYSEKSPVAAGVFSAVLPGSGQLYVGRPVDAALAFALNAAFIWGAVEAYDNENWAVFSLLGLMEVGLYGGNIYNAVNGAHLYNEKARAEYLKKLQSRDGLRLGLQPRDKAVSLSWSVKY